MPLSTKERDALRKRCPLVVPGFEPSTPADEHRRLAVWCETRAIEHDRYGDGDAIGAFEARIAALLGKPAAVFMPSGVMAQLAAVRIWTERASLARFGLHPTSHLLHHEEEASAALLGLHGVPVGDRLRPLRADDLAAIRQALACVFVELPIRVAGGQLPTWDELAALKTLARDRDLPLHMDGARLWECAAYYGRDHATIADGFASVYVSLYKGIGAVAGAMLAGDADFVATARLWRRRLGGTLHHLGPLVESAAMRFDERLALMPALYRRTLSFAEHLQREKALRVNPPVPHVNMLHLYVDAPADAVLDARDRIAAEHGCWLLGAVQPAEVPGWSVSEIYVGDRLLRLDDAVVQPLFAELCERIGKH